MHFETIDLKQFTSGGHWGTPFHRGGFGKSIPPVIMRRQTPMLWCITI